jgi:hypothetical protein
MEGKKMAYTLCNSIGEPKAIRLLSATGNVDGSITVKVQQPFIPHWWSCDPCNHSQSRYMVTYREGAEPQGYAWYMVATTDDDQSDIDAKVAHYLAVMVAKQAADKAHKEWQRLNGF